MIGGDRSLEEDDLGLPALPLLEWPMGGEEGARGGEWEIGPSSTGKLRFTSLRGEGGRGVEGGSGVEWSTEVETWTSVVGSGAEGSNTNSWESFEAVERLDIWGMDVRECER